MSHNVYIYIAMMAGVTYAIRVPASDPDPEADQQRFHQSFLYYVPLT